MSKENDVLNTIIFTMKKEKERSIQRKELNFKYFNHGIKDSIFSLYSKIGFNTFSPFKNKILNFKKESKCRLNIIFMCISSTLFIYPITFLSFYFFLGITNNATSTNFSTSSVIINFLNNPLFFTLSCIALPIGVIFTLISFFKKQKHLKELKSILEKENHSENYKEKINEYSVHLISLLTNMEKRLNDQDFEFISEIIHLKEYLIDETYKMNYEEKGFESDFKKLYDYNLNELLICRESKLKNLKDNNIEEKLIIAEKNGEFKVLTLEEKLLKIQSKILDKKVT